MGRHGASHRHSDVGGQPDAEPEPWKYQDYDSDDEAGVAALDAGFADLQQQQQAGTLPPAAPADVPQARADPVAAGVEAAQLLAVMQAQMAADTARPCQPKAVRNVGPKGQKRCGKCGELGHNARTCGKTGQKKAPAKRRAVELYEPEPDSDTASEVSEVPSHLSESEGEPEADE